MPVSQQEAAEALLMVESTESRSATLRGYRDAASQFFLWGVLWVVGYGLTQAMPARGAAIWAVVVVVGIAAGAVTLPRRSGGSVAWRYAGVMSALTMFCVATVAVMRPHDGRQLAAFIPLVVATGYVICGIWLGGRLVVAGIALALLTLAGFFLLPAYFFAWMAIVGGGALLLAGFWLTRA